MRTKIQYDYSRESKKGKVIVEAMYDVMFKHLDIIIDKQNCIMYYYDDISYIPMVGQKIITKFGFSPVYESHYSIIATKHILISVIILNDETL